ncbi:LLM class oxidoreductase [Flagellimonas nanhaiensis]|uniref:LLM class oxidoreductase n=1 Tax=Flagellimonas nanhaiensis TaxID=2292706 RepID=A0A371JTB5_9FLAO|nr:LLM class oxidoreductase [Allomuricauda nanhaiensis]RDY61044.1 LLM class oxidoreductase [Allomuricauda nanhaiensis]
MKQLQKIAKKGKLSLGLVFPLESYTGSIAKMENQETLAKRAEELGFKALWFRDVPFNDPSFGDAGQLYDPWVYMTHIMNHTKEIALATGSIVLPLRHPVHTAKSLNSIQLLSNGRVIMGIASGDRPSEYPAFNQDINKKSTLFQDNFFYLKALQGDFPRFTSKYYGYLQGTIDLVPKQPHSTPMLVTGHSGQTLDWIAEHADGWLYYPRNLSFLEQIMRDWKLALERNGQPWKPYMQSLYVDLLEEDTAPPTPIHLGFKSGSDYLVEHLKFLESLGVNHVIFNLKYGSRPVAEMLEELGDKILPHFN